MFIPRSNPLAWPLAHMMTREDDRLPPYIKPTHSLKAKRVANTASLPSGFGFTRASGATRINHRGYLETVGNDVLRHTYDPSLEYNLNLNPWGDGAVAGVIGAGGALPTGWAGFTANMPAGSVTVIGTQVRQALEGLVVRIAGTPTGTGASSARLGSDDTVAAGTVVANRVFVELVAGSLANVNPSWVLRSGSEAGTAFVLGAFAAISDVRTLTGTSSSTAVRWNYGNTTDPVDFTIWIGFPTRTHAASPITDRVPLATLAARINGIPQYGLRGLLLEEAGTNCIRNPRLEGGVAGSPGTYPTYVSRPTTLRGLTQTLEFPAATQGVTPMDWSLSGDSTSFGAVVLRLDETTGIAAVAGQTWTGSVFLALTGSPTNISEYRLQIQEFTAAGAEVAGATSTLTIPTTSLTATLTRFSVTRMLTGGTTAFVGVYVTAVVASVATTLSKLRVASPQLEQTLLSSVILPPAGAPAVTTRARDNLTLPAGLNGARLSFAMRFALLNGTALSGHVLFLSQSGGAGDCVRVYVSSGAPMIQKRKGGTYDAVFARGGVPSGFTTAAFAIGGGEALGSWDGGAVVSDTSTGVDLTPLNVNKVNGGPTSNDGAGIILSSLDIWDARKLTKRQLKREAARTE